MKKALFFLSLIALVVLSGCLGPISLNTGNNSQVMGSSEETLPNDNVAFLDNVKYFEHQLVILYEDRTSAEDLVNMIKGRIVDEIPQLKAILVEIPVSVREALSGIRELLRDQKISGIRAIEPNYIRELEPVIKEEMTRDILIEENLEPYQWALETLHATEVWGMATGNGVVVAVFDTGVDGTHPDLQGQLVDGYDPYYGISLPADEDSDTYGHGTHVAGIIAARRDGVGVTGLAYNAKIMPIRIFEPYYVGDFYVAAGVVWAVDNGADVLSNSWGGWGYSYILHEAFDYALQNNVVVVVSAGNEKTDQHFTYPAGLPGVIAVGATTVNDETISWSSKGDYLSVGAPGVRILSTIPVAMAEDEGVYGLPYAYWDGTSMACPYVSALVALIKEKYPQATPYQIRKMIEETADDIDEPGYDTSSGYGRIDPLAALNMNPSEAGEGGFLSVVVTDRAGNPLPAVFVTIKNKETGKVYYGKTDIGLYDGEVDADFLGIEPGEYDVIIGGPDPTDLYSPFFGFQINTRIEEELQRTTTVTVSSSSSLVVSFQSSFSVVVNPGEPLPDGAQISLYLLDSSFSIIDQAVGTENLQVEIPADATPDYYWLYYVYSGDLPQLDTLYQEDFESGQIPSDWTPGGDVPPFVQSTEAHSGNYALQFGDVDDNQESWVEFTLQNASTAVLSFMVKVSSEAGWDFFKLYVDGEEYYRISGEVDWTQVSVGLQPGEHTIRFAYEKDVSYSAGMDTAWIDDIVVTEGIILNGEVNINGNVVPVYGMISPNTTYGFIDERYGGASPWCIF